MKLLYVVSQLQKDQHKKGHFLILYIEDLVSTIWRDECGNSAYISSCPPSAQKNSYGNLPTR
jgi:hypothetical protein